MSIVRRRRDFDGGLRRRRATDDGSDLATDLDVHVGEREVVEDEEDLVLEVLGGHGDLVATLRPRQQRVDVGRVRDRLLHTGGGQRSVDRGQGSARSRVR